MEPEYNWDAISYGAVPVSVIIAVIFFMNISRNWKFFYLIIGFLAAAGITYYFDRKRQNIYTSAFIVIAVSLIIYGLKNLGWF